MIQQSLAQPLYQHIKDHIIANIRNGKFNTGERVPSENELTNRFSVSRMTANRALRELTQEGWIKRVAGLGSFVSEPSRHSSLIEICNIADEIAARGNQHNARIISHKKITANAALATEMELTVGTKLFYVRLVHCENNIPVQLEERYVNLAFAPDFAGQDFSTITPTAYLVANVDADEIEHTVVAALPDKRQAQWLKISPSEPCLTLTRRTWHKGQVVTLVTLIYPANRYALIGRHKRKHRR